MKQAAETASGREKATGTLLAAMIAALAVTSTSAALQVRPTEAGFPNPPAIMQVTVRRIVVSLPDRKLALLRDGQVVKIYRVAIGKPSTPSPAGDFRIINRVTNPTYYHKGQVVPAGKNNPVGSRWMGLSAKGYGIHGTNQSGSIGKAASTGCIRMSKRDLEELFTLVKVGDAVEIRTDRDDSTTIFGSTAQRVAQAQVESASATGGQ